MFNICRDDIKDLLASGGLCGNDLDVREIGNGQLGIIAPALTTIIGSGSLRFMDRVVNDSH